ncbi:MAG: 2'-5' RNA ligase family protein [Aureibaculum sp.]|nr:2'-5' RNA ligase family protein [Aureibaculum sp.]
MSLYFIAIIPHLELKDQIQSLKEEMKERFHAKHAIKSPAHITLQMPFKRNKEDEHSIIERLQNFASNHNLINIELNGFGCFSPRVIFIKVKDHTSIVELHSNLKKVLIDELSFKENEISNKIHPHMTIATRDLTDKAFLKAWPEFEQRKFKASFTVKNLFLLKHNGKYWDIFKEFLFQE